MAGKKDRFKVEETRPIVKGGRRLGTRVFMRDASSNESKVKVYLNPYGKGRKFSREIRDQAHYTNSGTLKDKAWTREAQAYRCGYLDARKDSAALWKSKKDNRSK